MGISAVTTYNRSQICTSLEIVVVETMALTHVAYDIEESSKRGVTVAGAMRGCRNGKKALQPHTVQHFIIAQKTIATIHDIFHTRDLY